MSAGPSLRPRRPRVVSLSLVLSSLVSSLVLAACPDRSISELDPTQSRTEIKDIPETVNRELDLLFVIDNSKSMDEEQASLERNFGAFIDVLEHIQGGLPSLHIAVVSSDMGGSGRAVGGNCDATGDDGAFNTRSRDDHGDTPCSMLGSGATFLADVDDGAGRVRNYTGQLTDAFACIAHVGDRGCGLEQHLHAMAAALDPDRNPGFLRPGAQLGIVIIADEDDCSAADGGALFDPALPLGNDLAFRCFSQAIACDSPLSPEADGPHLGCAPVDSTYLYGLDQLAQQVRAYKGGSDDAVFVAGIFGDTDHVAIQHVVDGGATRPDVAPSCSYTDAVTHQPQTARPGLRLSAFVHAFPHAVETTICDGDLSDPLHRIAAGFVDFLDGACLDGVPQDGNPATPELEPECTVAELVGADSDDPVQTPIPACADDASARPCWKLVEADACADTPSGLRLTIERDTPAPIATRILAQCAIE